MPGPRQCCPCPGGWRWLPALRWLPRYSLAWLQLDLMAGLTVGLTVVPQALAYAEVAGLPLQYGLYSSFTGCFVYCFLGTAKDVTLGPTAIMSLLVSSYAFHEPVYAVLLAFLSGCIQLAMGLLHLGFLLDFISCPVIKGFTSAASITISFNQVKNILGLQGIPRQFFLQVYETLRRIGETRAGDAVLGLACLAALAGLQAMKSRLPRAAGAEPLAARVSYLIVWTTATGALATPCSLPSRGCPCWGPVSLGQGRDSLKLVKTRSAGAETWRWVTEDQVPRLVLPLYMSLPKAWKSSAARIPTSCCPSCCSGLQACFHGCSLCCSTQRPGGPVCWPGCLLLPGDGLPATDTHRQHPPGPPGLPAAALLHGCTQRHRPLPEHGGGHGGRAGRGPAHGPAGDHCDCQGFWAGPRAPLCDVPALLLGGPVWHCGWGAGLGDSPPLLNCQAPNKGVGGGRARCAAGEQPALPSRRVPPGRHLQPCPGSTISTTFHHPGLSPHQQH
ncbi:sodium-independent sulfate anion transporter isoform X8 [Apus apus]|uniref:sodium-independent sulfate anion transporter isoform X8 n=1 Tax=Apus apus TaxID=8895 RepID=UPI0021F88BF4|nr:sodium-independent sulfate anion transporter isoform X8 [Apus apus]